MLTNKSQKKKLLNSLSSAIRSRYIRSLSSFFVIFIVIASVFTVLNFIPVAHGAIILKQTATNYCTNLTGPSSCTVTVGPLSAGDVIVLTTALELFTSNAKPPPWVSTVNVPKPNPFSLLKENNVLNVNPLFETQVWISTISSAYNFNNYTITVQTNNVNPTDGQQLQVTAFVVNGISTNVPSSNIAVAPYASCQTCTTSTLVTVPSGQYFAVMVTARNQPAYYTAGTGFTPLTPQGQTGFVEYSLSGLSGQTNFPFSMDQAYSGLSIGVIFTPPPLPPNSFGPVVVKQFGTTYCQVNSLTGGTCTLTGLGPFAVGDVIVLAVSIRINTSITVVVNSIGALDSFTMLGQAPNTFCYPCQAYITQIWTTQITTAYNNNNYQISVPFSLSQSQSHVVSFAVQVTAYVVVNIPAIPPNGNIQTFLQNGGSCIGTGTSVALPSAYFAVLVVAVTTNPVSSQSSSQNGWNFVTPTGQYGVSAYSTSLSNPSTSTNFPACTGSYSMSEVGVVFPASSYTTITNLATLTATLFATVTSVYSAYTLVTSTLIVTSTNIINQLISYPSALTFQFWFWPVFMWILFTGLFVAFGRMANADGKAFIILIMLGLMFGSIVGTLMGVTPVIFIPIFALLLVLALWKLH